MHYFIIGNSQQIAAKFSLTLVLAVLRSKTKIRSKNTLRPSLCCCEVKFSLKLGLRPNLGLRLLS